MNALRVIVCDDHRVMREALAGYLAAQPAVAAVDTAADVDEAIRIARHHGDVLILDLALADDQSGLEALEALQNLGIAIPVLVMSGPNEIDLPARALSLGALGFCPKSASPQDLYAAVIDVAAGRTHIPDDLLEPVLEQLVRETRAAKHSRAVLAALTAREQEVLRLLGQGVCRHDIARRLGLSSNTVRTHIRHVMEKLGVSNQLAAAARGRELLERARSFSAEGPVPELIDLTGDLDDEPDFRRFCR